MPKKFDPRKIRNRKISQYEIARQKKLNRLLNVDKPMGENKPVSLRFALGKLNSLEEGLVQAKDAKDLVALKTSLINLREAFYQKLQIDDTDQLAYPGEDMSSVEAKILEFEIKLEGRLSELRDEKAKLKEQKEVIHNERESRSILEELENKLEIAKNNIEELKFAQAKRQYNLIQKKTSNQEILQQSKYIFDRIEDLHNQNLDKKDQEKKRQDVTKQIGYFEKRLSRITADDYNLAQKKLEDEYYSVKKYIRTINGLLAEIKDEGFVRSMEQKFEDLVKDFEDFSEKNNLSQRFK